MARTPRRCMPANARAPGSAAGSARQRGAISAFGDRRTALRQQVDVSCRFPCASPSPRPILSPIPAGRYFAYPRNISARLAACRKLIRCVPTGSCSGRRVPRDLRRPVPGQAAAAAGSSLALGTVTYAATGNPASPGLPCSAARWSGWRLLVPVSAADLLRPRRRWPAVAVVTFAPTCCRRCRGCRGGAVRVPGPALGGDVRDRRLDARAGRRHPAASAVTCSAGPP